MLDDTLQRISDDATPLAARRFAELAAAFLAESARGECPVTAPAGAAALYRALDSSLPMGGASLEEILHEADELVMQSSIRLSHPMYLGHQVSAPLPAAVWSEQLISVLNNSLAVQEMSPSGTVVETRIIRWMCQLAGLPEGAGGTFTSGGTEATFTALLAARAACRPEAWQRGVGANPPVIVCGEHAHYAVTRAAGELGIGMDQVVAVPSRDYRMDADELERIVERLAREERDVMAVVATAGSTATGSFDDLERIGQLCKRRDIWLHVDGAHGASALLSPVRRAMVAGIEHASSIAWDPHKMMLMPLSCGMLLVRDEARLAQAFAQRAPYLFHERSGDRSWDQGPRSFACSRRFDALKVWIALKRYGADGIGALYDHLCDLTSELAALLREAGAFEVLHEPACNILCFRWPGTLGAQRLALSTLNHLNRQLRDRYNASGEGWITTTMLDGMQVLRVTIMNPRTTRAHLEHLVTGLLRVAQALEQAPERIGS
ncbi:MAG TPA: aminotransferase class V-fold PLP-dependent enzyme [Gemmatimonadales bacterium]|nr:aminotransferase class V-fold PLP-dependent enzyme [Gemmatimonadales bacterium]